jgi:hypothetical protein
MNKSSIYNCELISLNKIPNRAGNITIVEGMNNIPFEIKRVYYLYDIPGGEARGGHAHKELKQLIIATSGAFSVILDDGNKRKTLLLNRPDFGLMIVPGIWRELVDFSSGAICLVLASLNYDEQDYIRDYSEFTSLKTKMI